MYFVPHHEAARLEAQINVVNLRILHENSKYSAGKVSFI